MKPEGSGSDEPILVKETDEFFDYGLYRSWEDVKAEGIVSDEDCLFDQLPQAHGRGEFRKNLKSV